MREGVHVEPSQDASLDVYVFDEQRCPSQPWHQRFEFPAQHCCNSYRAIEPCVRLNHLGGSTRTRPGTRASKVTALDPRTTGSRTLPQRAGLTAVPELEEQSRHEDEDSRPPSTMTCPEPPVPSSSSAPPCGGDGPQDWHLLASSLPLNICLKTGTLGYLPSQAMNATHGDHPRASVTPRLHLRTRGFSRQSSASLSSTPRDSPRDCRK